MQRSNGFTLIELMIVVSIIGILAATAVPMYQNFTNKSSAQEMVSLAKGYKSAVSMCVQDNSQLADPLDPCDADETSSYQGKLGSLPLGYTVDNNAIGASTIDGIIVTNGTINITSTATAYHQDTATTMIYAPTISGSGLTWALDLGNSNCDERGLC